MLSTVLNPGLLEGEEVKEEEKEEGRKEGGRPCKATFGICHEL